MADDTSQYLESREETRTSLVVGGKNGVDVDENTRVVLFFVGTETVG